MSSKAQISKVEMSFKIAQIRKLHTSCSCIYQSQSSTFSCSVRHQPITVPVVMLSLPKCHFSSVLLHVSTYDTVHVKEKLEASNMGCYVI